LEGMMVLINLQPHEPLSSETIDTLSTIVS